MINLLCAIREEKVTKYLLLFENGSTKWFEAHELRPEVLKLGQWKFPDNEIEAIDDTWFAFVLLLKKIFHQIISQIP